MPSEKAQAAPTARPKVAMRRRGADCPVVAIKRGNARGAKGVGHQHWIGSTDVGKTGSGRSPINNERRQPSLGGTSRMMREYQVRFCEGLGVKFPGSTRHDRIIPGDSTGSSLTQQAATQTVPEPRPRLGELVVVRSRRWLVDEVIEPKGPGQTCIA